MSGNNKDRYKKFRYSQDRSSLIGLATWNTKAQRHWINETKEGFDMATNYDKYLSSLIEFSGTHTDRQIGDICNGITASAIASIRRKHLKDTGTLIPKYKCKDNFHGNQHTKNKKIMNIKKTTLTSKWVSQCNDNRNALRAYL